MNVSTVVAGFRTNGHSHQRWYQPLLEVLEDRSLPSVSGPLALVGSEASHFTLPQDVRLVGSSSLPMYGLQVEHYQQMVGEAEVYGGQLTIHRDSTGTPTTVIGAYYADIVPSNSVAMSPSQVAQAVMPGGWSGYPNSVQLLIDPLSGRYFYQVETQETESRWVHQLDATTGQVLSAVNTAHTLQFGEGIGVLGDVKDLSGLSNYHNSGPPSNRGYWLESTDGRQRTYDADNRNNGAIRIFVDSDNVWDGARHPAAVDAQFYANVTDDFYQTVFGRNSYDNQGSTMNSTVHVGSNLDNAFWNGSGVFFGDGDGVSTQAYSAGLDVVAHEWSHAVTQYTSNLVYQNESGALNEAFSDIMGAAVEYYYYLADPNNDPNVIPDTVWFVGEDIDIRPLSVEPQQGFRNMKTPREDEWYGGIFPDHYDDRYTGTLDNGGVHINSNIVNHAFYLLVVGGFNASGGSVEVSGIGFNAARDIFYSAFTALNSTANFLAARNATVATAQSLFGASSPQAQSVANAWLAVGVGPSAPDTTPPTSPTGLSAVPGDGQVALDWGNNPEADLLGYNVYRSTNSETGFVKINGGPLTTSAFSDTTVVNGTTYFYRVTAVDTSGNESTPSAIISATPSQGTTSSLHIGDIDGFASSKANGRKWQASVVIVVHDADHTPLANAVVTGTWSGAGGATVTGTTNSNGVVTFSTGNLSNDVASISFTITNINGVANPSSDTGSNSIDITNPNGSRSSVRIAPDDSWDLAKIAFALATEASAVSVSENLGGRAANETHPGTSDWPDSIAVLEEEESGDGETQLGNRLSLARTSEITDQFFAVLGTLTDFVSINA